MKRWAAVCAGEERGATRYPSDPPDPGATDQIQDRAGQSDPREYGIIIPKGLRQVRGRWPGILEDAENGLSFRARRFLSDLVERVRELDERIRAYDKEIQELFKEDERSQRIEKVEGIGPVVATAILAAVGNGTFFKHGRQLSAWLGLVPRQHSTGGRERLLGISKRGDRHF